MSVSCSTRSIQSAIRVPSDVKGEAPESGLWALNCIDTVIAESSPSTQ